MDWDLLGPLSRVEELRGCGARAAFFGHRRAASAVPRAPPFAQLLGHVLSAARVREHSVPFSASPFGLSRTRTRAGAHTQREARAHFQAASLFLMAVFRDNRAGLARQPGPARPPGAPCWGPGLTPPPSGPATLLA